MTQMTMIQWIGMACGIILPLWNIPLILRMCARRSSQDISMAWAIGVWVCLVLMMPAALISEDLVFRTFSIVNFFLFTFVVATVLFFRLVKRK